VQQTPYSSIARLAKFYDLWLWLCGYNRSVENFMGQLPFGKDMPLKVLDAGCGSGLYIIAVLNRYPNAHVAAFDSNEKLMEYLRHKLKNKKLDNRTFLFAADIQSQLLELGDKKFDLIITAGVLEYVPIEKTVQNLSRFLIPEGYFLNSPVKDNFFGQFVAWLYGCKPYSQTRNLKAFTNNGFVLEKQSSAWHIKDLHIFRKGPFVVK
jgi:ubiquinone/menaquinone biosynthesis C-methylase UbiE